MNQLLSNLLSARKNPHVSIPIALSVVCELGPVWLPAHADQFRLTGKILLGYGAIAAANSAPEKTDTPPKP